MQTLPFLTVPNVIYIVRYLVPYSYSYLYNTQGDAKSHFWLHSNNLGVRAGMRAMQLNEASIVFTSYRTTGVSCAAVVCKTNKHGIHQ
eukprot:1749581-Pleurochrysis_carterae.AAC.1